EVVTKAAQKITDRVKSSTTFTFIETTDNTEDHLFDNVKGDQHVTGIYRFINEIDQVQMFKYDTRVMFDFTVPEPAALIWDRRQQERQVSKASIPQVRELKATPEEFDLNQPNTWQQSLNQYQVDASSLPPPLDLLTVSKTFSVNNNPGA